MVSQPDLKVDCPICDARMVLRTSKRFTYPNGEPRMFWGCSRWPECDGIHGAHPDGKPLGKPGDKKTKEERIVAHGAFDTLWKYAYLMPCYMRDRATMDEEGKTVITRAARRRAYAWMQEQLGMTREECHIANFDIETCIKVTSLCARASPEIIRNWWKGRKNARHPQQQES